jgi:hypothetical protein
LHSATREVVDTVLEERIEMLEETITKMEEQIKLTQNDKWVTPNELANIMNCSVNNIYIKIRSGEIYATDKLGSIKRIPMSQFYKNEIVNEKEKQATKKLSMKEKVFGIS